MLKPFYFLGLLFSFSVEALALEPGSNEAAALFTEHIQRVAAEDFVEEKLVCNPMPAVSADVSLSHVTEEIELYANLDEGSMWNRGLASLMLKQIKKRKTFVDCGLTDAEIIAIYFYTKEGYQKINSKLRRAEINETNSALVAAMNSGLNKLADYSGVVRRGVSFEPGAFLDQHQVGKNISYLGYTSTGIDFEYKAKNKIIIISKSCKYIAPISVFPKEREVLCPHKANFKILFGQENNFLLEQL